MAARRMFLAPINRATRSEDGFQSRSFFDTAAVVASMFVKHHHIGDLIRLGQIVRDEHRNLAPLAQCLAELGRQLAPQRRIQRRERLVEQQHIGIGRERARERDALLLTAGKLRGVPRAERADAQSIDDPSGVFGSRDHSVHFARDAVGDVPRDGHVREERVSLEHVPDAPLLRRQVDALGAVEQTYVLPRRCGPSRV